MHEARWQRSAEFLSDDVGLAIPGGLQTWFIPLLCSGGMTEAVGDAGLSVMDHRTEISQMILEARKHRVFLEQMLAIVCLFVN